MMWRNPNIVPAEYQSTVSHVVAVLVAVPQYPDPVPGYYLAVLGEWRVIGSPSHFHPIAWQPKPEMPRPDQLTWLPRRKA